MKDLMATAKKETWARRPRHVLLIASLMAAFVVGCEENEKVDTGKYTHTLTVPDTAKVVAEGTGTISYRAPDDGRIFVMDVDTNTVIAAKRVREGQKFTLNPDA